MQRDSEKVVFGQLMSCPNGSASQPGHQLAEPVAAANSSCLRSTRDVWTSDTVN